MKWDIENQKIVAKYLNRLAGVYDVAIKKAVGLGYSVTNYNSDKPFSFADYPVTSKKADTLFSQMGYEVQSIVNGGTESAWMAANTVNDGIVDKYFAKSGLSKEQLSKYYDRNLNALAAYQKRIDGGVTLSDRVWKYTNQFKNEIELAVSVGIGEGRSAAEVSRDVRQYLQQPDKLFRRVRNKYGELVLSKAAKAYHPGQGVYRSSYKNALRLTRTEINMSFHNADYERWNTLDFIGGYRVVLSKAHPEYDICDELQGEYPKTFAFWGWHVQCMCHTEPILSPQKEFVSNLVKQLKGEDITGYVPSNQITQMPPNFKQWAFDNQERIKKAKSMPYFIDKNFKGTNVADWFKTAEKAAVIIYAKKKLAEADKLGVTGEAYDALVAAIENESLSYAQIAGRSSKLVKEIKAAKAIAADPLGRVALEKQFAKKDVDSLFTAYDSFYAKLDKYSLDEKIGKITFEIDWLKANGKYATSGKFSEMLQRDLIKLKEQQRYEVITDRAKFFAEKYKDIKDKEVRAVITDISKTVKGKAVDLDYLQALNEKAENIITQYERTLIDAARGKNPLTLENLNAVIAKFKKENPISEKMEGEINKALKRLIDDGEYCMRFNGRDITGIMEHGFLNQMELKALGLQVKSGGCLNPEYRMQASAELFGTNLKKANPFDFEHYGYLGDKDMLKEMTNYKPSQYGSTIAYFKKKDVTCTFTMQDSLGSGLNPTLTTSPGVSSISEWSRNSLLSNIKKHNGSIYDFTRNYGTSYIELQYHGKTVLEQVDRIFVSENDLEKFTPQIRKVLKDKYKIRLFKYQDGDIVEF